MKVILRVYVALMLLSLPLMEGCVSRQDPGDRKTGSIVFKHGKIAGDPDLFRNLIDRFEKDNPGITIKDETLPASTDEQHQFYVINLEGRSSDFDVLSMDVIWVPEFARAGWLRDLSHLLPEKERKGFFPGPMEAVTYQGRYYAIPWYIDAGLLYYRKDLLERHGLSPPETWQELANISRKIIRQEPDLYGFIWQGKQYEGLVCNVLEYFWSNDGEILKEGKVVINRPENIEALQWMVDSIHRHPITPPLVLTAIEEPTRHLFGNGKALFMRNWPYAWNIFQKEGSPVKGKVGISKLPSFPGKTSASTLGGWQLGVNRFSNVPEAAERFISFLTSSEAQKTLALTIGYKPTRTSLYRDQEIVEKQPFMVSLFDILLEARPRPITPYYMMMTQVLQPEFSAALSRIKTPAQALNSAQRQIEKIIGVDK